MSARRRFFVSVQLTVRLKQSEYVIQCPDGACHQVEDGNLYVVMPSPFEVDEPDEMLWLRDTLLVEKARAGAWGLFLVSETIRKDEKVRQTRHRQPAAIRTGKTPQIDRLSRKRSTPVAAGTAPA